MFIKKVSLVLLLPKPVSKSKYGSDGTSALRIRVQMLETDYKAILPEMNKKSG
jgi:hypothetical protein